MTTRNDIEIMEAQLNAKKAALKQKENNCNHKWRDPIEANIYKKSYTVPGDAPGTMGVDWRGDCFVPAKTTKRWSRECRLCGKVEYTFNTTKITTLSPKF